MKKLLFVLIVLFINSSAQENKTFLNSLNYSFLTGVNSQKLSEYGGIFLFELSSDVNENLRVKLSTGYYKSMQPMSRIIRSSATIVIENETYYFAGEHKIIRKNYDVFPFSIGANYFITRKKLSPYIAVDLSYNYVSTKLDHAPGFAKGYSSYEEIPEIFKIKYEYEELPTSSLGAGLGIGTELGISEHLNLDVRYLYKYHNEIVSIHQLYFGIVF